MNSQTIKDDSDDKYNMYDDKEYGLEEATDLGWEHFKVAISQFRETLDRPSEFFIRDLDLPQMRAAMGPEWPGLKPSQRDDVVLMKAAETGKRGMANGGVLANGAGLGKTPDIIANELHNPLAGPTLIVMPASLIDNWEEEFTKFTKPRLHTLRYHNKLSFDELQNAGIVLVSYDQLRNEFRAIEQWEKDAQYAKRHPYPWPAYRKVGKKPKTVHLNFKRPRFPLLRVHWKRVIYEEAQKCKNFRTTTGKACHAVIAENRWLVTGTPFTNEYSDVYSIFRILRITPFDDFGFFRSHFLRRLPKSTKEDGRSLREGEIAPLDVLRTAFIFIALQVESIRRTRASTFDGHSLQADLPPLKKRVVELPLDDGRKYGKFFQYKMEDCPNDRNNGNEDLVLVDEFFKWAVSTEPVTGGEGMYSRNFSQTFGPVLNKRHNGRQRMTGATNSGIRSRVKRRAIQRTKRLGSPSEITTSDLQNRHMQGSLHSTGPSPEPSMELPTRRRKSESAPSALTTSKKDHSSLLGKIS
jgi:hypothetical protein